MRRRGMEDWGSDVGMDSVAAAIFSLDGGNKDNYLLLPLALSSSGLSFRLVSSS